MICPNGHLGLDRQEPKWYITWMLASLIFSNVSREKIQNKNKILGEEDLIEYFTYICRKKKLFGKIF